MPRYRVTASDAGGRTRTLRQEAPSEGVLLRSLADRGYVVLSVREEKGRSSGGTGRPLNLEQHEQFCASLAGFLKSGLPLAQVLGLLERTSSKNQRMGDLYRALRESVESGRSLAVALKDSGVFRPVLLGLVESAEASSKLPEILDRAARLFGDELKLRRKIQSAVTYPLAMLTVGLGVVAFLLTYVVPRLTGLFAEIGAQLPLPTRVLLGVAGGVKALALPALILLLVAFLWLRRRGGRVGWPFFRGTRQQLALALVFAHLSTLLKSGIPLVQALELTAPMDRDRSRWLTVAESVRMGYRFSQGLERQGGFPEDILAVLRIAELGGDLPDSLERLGTTCWDRSQASLQRLADLAEPAIIVVLGGMVAFVVVAVLLPVFDISSLIR